MRKSILGIIVITCILIIMFLSTSLNAGMHSKERILAIVQFNNITQSDEYGWLSSGIPESLTTDFSQLKKQLKVIDNREIIIEKQPSFYEIEKDPSIFGKFLGVNILIVGSFTVLDKIRIDVRSCNVETAEVTSAGWFMVEKGNMDSINKAYSQIVYKIATDLGLKITQEAKKKIEKPKRKIIEAYKNFTFAKESSYKKNYEESKRYNDKALRIDPEYEEAREFEKELKKILKMMSYIIPPYAGITRQAINLGEVNPTYLASSGEKEEKTTYIDEYEFSLPLSLFRIEGVSLEKFLLYFSFPKFDNNIGVTPGYFFAYKIGAKYFIPILIIKKPGFKMSIDGVLGIGGRLFYSLKQKYAYPPNEKYGLKIDGKWYEIPQTGEAFLDLTGVEMPLSINVRFTVLETLFLNLEGSYRMYAKIKEKEWTWIGGEDFNKDGKVDDEKELFSMPEEWLQYKNLSLGYFSFHIGIGFLF